MPFNLFTFFISLAGITSAIPQAGKRDSGFDGHATFNDFDSQGNINCKDDRFAAAGKMKVIDYNHIFGAAAGDLSQDLSAGLCNYTDSDRAHTMEEDAPGQSYKLPNPYTYIAPDCKKAKCGTCYDVRNKANNKKIVVQILDGCPSSSAWNYCKTGIDPASKCMQPNLNALDIEKDAYSKLSDDGNEYQSKQETD
ncbi:MAG: hypothetical protein LQ342_005486 [Letrouitia transgressa]|nr:MAG: hypothetical protein LQ342_005486 [Letrouitia transgressa]